MAWRTEERARRAFVMRNCGKSEAHIEAVLADFDAKHAAYDDWKAGKPVVATPTPPKVLATRQAVKAMRAAQATSVRGSVPAAIAMMVTGAMTL